MHYELWALDTGNLIRDYDTEAEALATVCDLLAAGWNADDLQSPRRALVRALERRAEVVS